MFLVFVNQEPQIQSGCLWCMIQWLEGANQSSQFIIQFTAHYKQSHKARINFSHEQMYLGVYLIQCVDLHMLNLKNNRSISI